jgi:hypothetical protein
MSLLDYVIHHSHRVGQLGRLSLVDHFRAAGEQLGLKLVRDKAEQGLELRGPIGGHEVVVEETPNGPHSWATKVTVYLATPLWAEFCVLRRWRPAQSTLGDTAFSGHDDIATADLTFDEMFEVRGHEPTARAVLTSDMRSALTTLARSGVVGVARGGVVYEILEPPPFSETRMPSQPGQDLEPMNATVAIVTLVRDVLAAAACLPRVDDLCGALAESVRSDPLPSVRERCLATVVAVDPWNPQTVAVIETGLADPSDAVRVVAAAVAGERGLPVLREIAMREDGEERLVARAVTALGRHLTFDEALAFLDCAHKRKWPALAAAAIEWLGRTDDARACRCLEAVVFGVDANMAIMAAKALGVAGSSVAEEVLIRALLAWEPDLRCAAVRALADTGHLASLAPLRALMEKSTTSPELASLARQAITAIGSRIPGASPGQISLAEGEGGRVSLGSETDAGRISIAADDKVNAS